ncbi:(deoxy)nucleoside triphosphate pyrophosphohydrolase [Paenibacillus athensensis]|uniref:8-oxo-dGTP diphosphatase n=1 Tax=Paenibacillus athensensis TaxID=1967502 RepID=A0A4Y8Q2W0_9BACL|nr:(deoxy)nucleoside triphosphate pyrophosphohydrolase [Paenibacillus athensensis]MCD1261415.1 (deoxy)nucleoside triphosphate pyrophosphohydrolase [Paenibacillus athensensis]
MKKVDVVGAVMFNEKNEVLCALRSQTMSLPGLWEFPGGKIEAGETPQMSLAREIQEELDCTIQVGDLVADATHEYPNVIVRLITYKATITEGIPTPKEHEKLIWLPLTEVDTLEWAPADLPTLQELKREFIE